MIALSGWLENSPPCRWRGDVDGPSQKQYLYRAMRGNGEDLAVMNIRVPYANKKELRIAVPAAHCNMMISFFHGDNPNHKQT